jgi:hypothetical protein
VRCYEELAGTYYQLREAIRVFSMREPGTAESDPAVDDALELAAKWERDVVAVWLHGSESVSTAVKELNNRITELSLEARSAHLTWEKGVTAEPGKKPRSKRRSPPSVESSACPSSQFRFVFILPLRRVPWTRQLRASRRSEQLLAGHASRHPLMPLTERRWVPATTEQQCHFDDALMPVSVLGKGSGGLHAP